MHARHDWREARDEAEHALSLLDYEMAVLRAHHEGYKGAPKKAVEAIEGAIADASRAAERLILSLNMHSDIPGDASALAMQTQAFLSQIARPALELTKTLAPALEEALSYKSFASSRRQYAEPQLERITTLDTKVLPHMLILHMRRTGQRYWTVLDRNPGPELSPIAQPAPNAPASDTKSARSVDA